MAAGAVAVAAGAVAVAAGAVAVGIVVAWWGGGRGGGGRLWGVERGEGECGWRGGRECG